MQNIRRAGKDIGRDVGRVQYRFSVAQLIFCMVI